MLKQDEVAFIKALSNIELSQVFLREMRKAMAARNKKKALVAPKLNATSASDLERQSGVGGDARTSRDSPQPSVSKRKADALSSSDCPSEPASCRHAPGHLFDDGPATQGTTGELAAQSSRQLGATESGLAYATVVAGIASPEQASGPHKSTAKGTVPNEPAASSEAAARRMSLGGMSGPLCGIPDGTNTYAQVASNSAAPAVERQNNTPIYVTGVTDMRVFLKCLRASCHIGLSAQIKGENLMFIPHTAEGFRAAFSALLSSMVARV